MFYDYKLSKVIETITVDEIGENIKTYLKDKPFEGDIQPVDEATRVRTWGKDVVGTLTLYADESLNVGDIVHYKKPYRIEKTIDWVDYKMYLLEEVKVIISD